MCDDEMIPTEAIAAVVYALTRRRVLSTVEVADIGGYAYKGVDQMLNKAARVIPLAKPARGVWMVNDELTVLVEQVRPVLDKVRRELDAIPKDLLYCRPMKRNDMEELVLAFEKLLRDFPRSEGNGRVG